MKALFFFMFSFSVFAQDPVSYLKNFDAKVYSLKSKGVQDFTVDIESPNMTKQINDQQKFGKVEELYFRVYWTANPERFAIEVVGLPDGFREFKEELKISMMGIIENLIPQTFQQRFTGYKFLSGSKPKEFIAQDTTGLAPIPSLVIKFDEQDKLVEVIGQKPVGTMNVKPVYTKESFADGKWVLEEQTTTTSESGQTISIQKELDYGKANGIGVLTELTVSTEQKFDAANAKPIKFSETISFKNYKINEGVALKYFLGEGKVAPTVPAKKP